jgi:uncharacterized protein (TIGR03437 family)
LFKIALLRYPTGGSMSKLFSRAIAVFALAFPVVALADTTLTLSSGQTLNLDTGKVVTSGGDLLWDGTNLTPQGTAMATDLPGESALYSSLTQSTTSELAMGGLSTAAITPAANDLIIAQTNGGNFSKIAVTTVGSGSITLKFNTFGGSSTPSGPTITGVVNNYSYIPAGFPNSGIAPGTLFLITGSGLASAPTGNLTLNSSASPGIPLTSAGASVSVQAGGKTFTPGLYYASPAQIAAVLPSGTPTGTATVTVTYNNATSNAFSFQVVPSALGFGTYSDGVIATNAATYALYGYTNSAKPGDTIVLWGSGLGADTADSDTVYTGTPHAVNTPLQIYFGGVAAHILYAGSSGFPGLNQIDVTIPENASTGCYVTVVGVTGTGSNITTSNFGHLAISPSGGECNDSIFGISGGTISTLSGQSTVRSGSLFVGQLISPKSQTDNTPQTSNIAFADFSKDTGSTYASSTGSSSSAFSLGSCFVSEIVSSGGGTVTSTGLDAGNISLTGPAGTYQLMTIPTVVGSYIAELPSNAITSSGGAFTFNGSGGADVGSFKTTVNLPNPILTWTNQSADATVNRGQGVTVDWTGGGSGTYVIIEGNSSDSSTGAFGSFTCITNQSALSFQVPGYVTSTLPAGSGMLDVENATSFGIFTATGLDFGFKFGFTGVSINSTYQ